MYFSVRRRKSKNRSHSQSFHRCDVWHHGSQGERPIFSFIGTLLFSLVYLFAKLSLLIVRPCVSPGEARRECPCQEGRLQEARAGETAKSNIFCETAIFFKVHLTSFATHILLRLTFLARSLTRRSAATRTWRTQWTRWGQLPLRRSSKLQGAFFKSLTNPFSSAHKLGFEIFIF